MTKIMMGYKRTVVLIVVLIWLPFSALAAEEVSNSKWDIKLGVGGMSGPEYEGADESEFLVMPYFNIEWNDRFYLSPHDGLGAHLYHRDDLSMRAGIGYDSGRDESDSSDLDGLGDIDSSATAKLSLEYSILGPVQTFIDATHYLGGSDGVEAEIGFKMKLPIRVLAGSKGPELDDHTHGAPKKTALMFAVSADWVDDNYMESYFGVDAQQAANSGLAEYNAESGFKAVNVELGLTYRITEHWSTNARFEYSKLIGDAADSPIVKDENQFSSGVFIAYRF